MQAEGSGEKVMLTVSHNQVYARIAARQTFVPAPATVESPPQSRVSASGKFFKLDGRKWYLKGLTYGPFAPTAGRGDFLPAPECIERDFEQIARLGANCIRVYHVPPRSLLDAALHHGLRVFVDVPWDKHRCFFEDWSAMEEARRRIRAAALDLGNHAGLFAMSVVNEIPSDVVRFYGRKRVGRFVDDLIATAKDEAPEALATFANYPSTEFLECRGIDFDCFNVYLDDDEALGRYLDRLQHISGPRPLVLGEFGRDSLRAGEEAQAAAVERHVQRVFAHGLAGSFVFSFTDDWFTGGHQVEDWAFGVTRHDRSEKLASRALRDVWQMVPQVTLAGDGEGPPAALPRVSVVVCSYNGASTLRGCLDALAESTYTNFEVIVVDDGSTDETPSIIAEYPWVRAIRQPNRGLSVARNVGAEAATGEIIAYTDSDCMPDPDWLHYLIDGMLRQNVVAIGGPNIVPPDDSWTAQCVANSPGGPSHVMLDDLTAEHVPGCNMAFRRDVLLGLGGFDAQFRQAGDDVDICWRLMDAGHSIGFANAALVWHHRRTTVRAYLKQQIGYGRSEAMLFFKHPQRFNRLGCSRWKGVIYGEGAVGLPLVRPAIYHGRQGSGLFQTVYASNQYSVWAYFTILEWHAAWFFLAALSFLAPALAGVVAVMIVLSLIAAARSTADAHLPKDAPWWCRPLIFSLHLWQPVARAWHRYQHRFSRRPLLDLPATPMTTAAPSASSAHAIAQMAAPRMKRINWHTRDAYWSSSEGVGREQLLESLVQRLQEPDCVGIYDDDWSAHDLRLHGDWWHDVSVRTVTEELGDSRRFTRARCQSHFTMTAWVMISSSIALLALTLATRQWWLAAATVGLQGLAVAVLSRSSHRCFDAARMLLQTAATGVGLRAVKPASKRELIRLLDKIRRSPPARIPTSSELAAPEREAVQV